MLVELLSFKDVFDGFKQSVIDKLFPNGWQPLVIQLFCTAVMFFVAAKFLFKPVRKILKERADHVENNIKEAETKNLDAAKKLEEANQNVLTSRVKAKEIVEEARLDSEKVKEKMILDAEEEVRQKKEQAQKEIIQERQKAVDEVHNEIVNVALEASKKVLEREVTAKDNERLVDNFIKDVIN